MPFGHDDIANAGLAVVGSATELRVCSAAPTDLATAISLTLATVTLVGGDFVIANGNTSGRKTTRAAKSALPVTTTGTGTHIVTTDATRLITEAAAVTPVALTSGGTVDVGAADYTITDAA